MKKEKGLSAPAEERNATEGVPYSTWGTPCRERPPWRSDGPPCRERPPWRSGVRSSSIFAGEPEKVKRNKAKVAVLAASLLTFAFFLLPSPEAPAVAPKPKLAPEMADVQDMVFLGESRPVLIRLHVRMDGKPVRQAWTEFMSGLFDYLDVNGDGVLDKSEAARAPSIAGIFTGGLSDERSGLGAANTVKKPTMAQLDLHKDGQVTFAEFATWYRENGFRPFALHLDNSAAMNPIVAIYSGAKPEPPVELVGRAIFDRLDTGRTGRLTKKELAAAADVLLEQDENEDEMITPRELVPHFKPPSNRNMFAGMMGRGNTKAPASAVIVLDSPGVAPPSLVRSMQERYGARSKKPEDKKLSRKDLGLDESTFRQLDTNGDGVLDAKELAGFVNRPPDIELMVNLGKKDPTKPLMEVARRDRPLTGKVKMRKAGAMLDLGVTRADLIVSLDTDDIGTFTAVVRQQYSALFAGADKDGNGYLDKKEADASPQFKNLFEAMDRNGDGKLTEKEMLDYLDHYAKMRDKATSSCISLILRDQSRGLFDLLDLDGDGRLSIREMRGAVRLLSELDREGKGYLTREDVPRTYQMTFRQGSEGAGGLQVVAFKALMGGGLYKKERQGVGPEWFRKMDRNRDGDVSRKEFLFSDELFRKIDADGDGLISVEEAERYDALMRKQK
jgi:Ca2+-binding EF-hand superfamily protein